MKTNILLSLFAILALSGCGGGSSGSDNKKQDDSTISISGYAIDGPIQNAKVCLDFNKDSKCNDDNEAMTNKHGHYTLSFPKSKLKIAENSNILLKGGKDTKSNESGFTLFSPYSLTKGLNNKNITPATHLVAKIGLNSTKKVTNLNEDEIKGATSAKLSKNKKLQEKLSLIYSLIKNQNDTFYENLKNNNEEQEKFKDKLTKKINDNENETKPDETKPDDTKPDDTKPDNTKPDDTKPDDTKPDDTKPDDNTKPDETKPDDTKPDDTKPDDTKPNDTKELDSLTDLSKIINKIPYLKDKFIRNEKIVKLEKEPKISPTCKEFIKKHEEYTNNISNWTEDSTDIRGTNLFFNISGLDDKRIETSNVLDLSVYLGNDRDDYIDYDSAWFTSNGCKAHSNQNKIANSIYENTKWLGSRYVVVPQNGAITKAGQVCKIYNPSGYTYGKAAKVVHISCKTEVNVLNPPLNELKFPLKNKIDAYAPKISLTRKLDGGAIANPSLTYTSDNEDVKIDKQTGKISIQNPQEGEMAHITIKPDSRYYESTQEVVLSIKIMPESALKVKAFEIGSDHVLPIGDRFQVVTPGNKTLIRALVYGSEQIIDGTLRIGSENFKLKCPQILKENEQDIDIYSLKDSCYTILSKEKAKLLHPGVVLSFDFGNDNVYDVVPKVSQKHVLNLVVFKVAGFDNMPSKEMFKRKLFQLFPISELNIEYRDDILPDIGMNAILRDLTIQQKQENARNKTYLALTSHGDSSVSGLAYMGQPAAVAKYSHERDFNQIIAHELGHTLGLAHAPCSNHSSSQIPDASGFWASGAWEGVEKAKLSPSPFFDQKSGKVIQPNLWSDIDGIPIPNSQGQCSPWDDHDIMSYCSRTRFTKYNYQRISDYMDTYSMYHVKN